MDITLRPYQASDWPQLWPILHEVFLAGDTFPNPPETSEEEARTYWLETPPLCTVAYRGEELVGSYHLIANQKGLGSHVANAGFVVKNSCRGTGEGRALGLDCLAQARSLGFRAMQFNLVVATNTASYRLWLSLGFTTIGRLPKAFNHQQLGLVDAFIMYREL